MATKYGVLILREQLNEAGRPDPVVEDWDAESDTTPLAGDSLRVMLNTLSEREWELHSVQGFGGRYSRFVFTKDE